jgi:hypothetical protein
MRHHGLGWMAVAALLALPATATRAAAQDRPPAMQERGFLSLDSARVPAPAAPGARQQVQGHNPNTTYDCRGPVSRVQDVAFEGVKTTSYNWSNTGGGGESGRFDRTPVLSTRVTLEPGTCLNAHLSALVGGRQTYGVASITMFQVTLTRLPGGPPQHMVGHFERPYGTFGPAVAIEAERDVDHFAANFFQRVGTGPGTVPAGSYQVDVWWSGGPVGGGGAIAADFVLKLYSR